MQGSSLRAEKRRWHPHSPGRKLLSVILVLLVVASLGAGISVVTGQDDAESPDETPTDITEASEIEYDPIGEELTALGEVDLDTDPALSEESREAAEIGAATGIERAKDAGIEVPVETEETAVEGAVHAAAQSQNASAEQIQAAAEGGSYGALVGGQSAEVTQLQAAIYGGAAGSLSQHQDAEIAQLRAASFGSAHGAIAQHQHAAVEQIQHVAIGGSAGAVHGAVQSQTASITQIQEAAQGGSYGALAHLEQELRLEQRQAAGFGGAGGGVEFPVDDPKKVQEASMAAASGALEAGQSATATQIQAAARGACVGTLAQYQTVTITQTQIITASAASGAISQHQDASIVQIQSAAQGASHGTVSLSQTQKVTIEQAQSRTTQAAAETVRMAIQINVQQSITIINYAKGVAEKPEPPEDDDLRSLFVAVDEQSVSLGNPNDVDVLVTIASDGDGDNGDRNIAVPAGESVTESLPAGEYTLTAETEDGRLAELSGEESLAITISEEVEDVIDLTVTVEGTTISIENPSDEPVDVTATNGDVREITISAGETASEPVDPGVWTLSGATAGEVTLNGEPELTVEIDDRAPELIELEVTVDGQTVSFTNPSDTGVTVSAAGADTEDRTVEVPAAETVDEAFEPGNYSLSGETDSEQEVVINGEETYELTVEGDGEAAELETLTVSIDDQTVTIENPNDEPVIVSGFSDSDNIEENQVFIAIGPADSVTEQFSPGEYTLRATVRFEDGTDPDDVRSVQLNGEDQLVFSIDGGELVGSVTGTVTDADTGEPIAGAILELAPGELLSLDATDSSTPTSATGDVKSITTVVSREQAAASTPFIVQPTHSVTTDDNGEYTIEDVLAEPHYISVWADGYVPDFRDIVVEPDETVTVDIALEPGDVQEEAEPDDPDENGDEGDDGVDNGEENGDEDDNGNDDNSENGDDNGENGDDSDDDDSDDNGDDNGDSNGNDDGNDDDTGDNDSDGNSENGEEDGNGNDNSENGDDDSTE